MKVGLIQIDGRIPNLALMQIAAYHRSLGDDVALEWIDPKVTKSYQAGLFSNVDRIYASILFSKNLNLLGDVRREHPEAIVGGTGIDYDNVLPPEIAAHSPGGGWFLYPDFNAHLGMSMKGCRLDCAFCGVRKKEGLPHHNEYLDAILTNPSGDNRLVLLDNDFFGGPFWRETITGIIDLNLKVSFAQGLNIRNITDEQAALLVKCRFHNQRFTKRQVTFAWDLFRDGKAIQKGIERCLKAGITHRQMQFFVLVGFNTTEEEDLFRINFLKKLHCDPYVMPYNEDDPYQNRLRRWVNHRPLFKSVEWADYRKPTTNSQIQKANRRFELPVLFG